MTKSFLFYLAQKLANFARFCGAWFRSICVDLDCVHTRCRHILKTVKNVTAAKFELAFTRYRNNLKTVGT